MKIEFQNGSEIESVHANDSIRGKKRDYYCEYIDNMHLKLWQKIYLKVYGWIVKLFWPHFRNKYRIY